LSTDLLGWLQERIWGGKITNFDEDWKSGQAMEELLPKGEGKKEVIKKKGSPVELVSKVLNKFSKAKIPPLFSAEELCKNPRNL